MLWRLCFLCFLWMMPLVGAPAHDQGETTRRSHKSLNPKAALVYSLRHRGDALLIIQDRKVLLEHYSPGNAADPLHRIYSGTKGFWAVAGMAAVEDGLMTLDDRVALVLPSWKTDSRKSEVTLLHLLNMTSGLEPDFGIHGADIPNRNTRAIRNRLVAPPGRSFIYGPASLQVFHEVLKKRLAPTHENPTTYLERRVLSPLGLRDQRYLPDHDGNPLLAAGFKMTAREWATLGECLLQGGQPVLKRGMLPTYTSGSQANPAFSMGFWNNHGVTRENVREPDIEETLQKDWWKQDWSHAVLCRQAPADLLASIGSCGQRLYVVPSENLVVVRLSRDSHFKDAEFLRLLFDRE